jgi:hypothetical protein
MADQERGRILCANVGGELRFEFGKGCGETTTMRLSATEPGTVRGPSAGV